MIKFLRFTILSIIGFIILLSIAPFFFDKSVIYNKFEEVVNEKIQQKVSFDKDIRLTFFPRPSLIINNVEFDDKSAGLNSNINKIKIISTWTSIINFKPKIYILEFFDPLLTFSDNKISSNEDYSKILIGNEINSKVEKISSYRKNLNKIKINNGIINFKNNNTFHKLKSVNFSIINGTITKSSGSLFYENYKVDLDFKIKTNDLKNFDLELIKTFNNKNKILTSGIIKLDNESLSFVGKSSSKLIKFSELIKSSQINFYFFNNKQVHLVNNNFKKKTLVLDAEIEKIEFKQVFFDKTKFQVNSNGSDVSIKGLKSSILDSSFMSNLNYKIKEKTFSGYGKLDKFNIKEKFFGFTEYDLLDGEIRCDFAFKGKNKKNSFLNFLNIEGNFNTGPMKFKGADFKKISLNFDNAETFADFLNLANKKNWKGFSKINSIKGKFQIKNSKVFLKDTETSHDNLKLRTNGSYSLLEDEVSVKNLIKIKTKKYENLPEFGVNFSGGLKNYKISYDLEKIRNQILTSGLNSILKKQKKIVIDPKSFRKLLKNKNNENSFNPNQIIDLFSD